MVSKLRLKFTPILTLVFTIIVVIFLLPMPVKGQASDFTPSQTPETNTQADGTETPSSTNTITPTGTSETPPQILNTPTTTRYPTTTTARTATVMHLPTATMTLTFKPSAVPTENLPPGDYVQDEVLVKLKARRPSQAFLGNLKSFDAEIKTELSALGVLLIKVPAGGVAEFIANIKSSPDVVYAEPNYLVSMVDTIPNDGSWGLQYGPAAIRAPQGWDLSTGSSAVTIAIIDSGIDQSHPDLAAKIVPGFDFVNNDSDPQDDNGHGSHVAGIAAASANNGLGIAGISWGARLMPVKVLNAAGNGSYANAALGIIWAADNGAQVINLSFGGTASSATLNAAVLYAYNKGVTIVAAAGNSGSNSILYPARYPEVIAVAATDSTNTRAGFSNYGPEMSVSAPGVSIYSSILGGAYGYKNGTSMSAPAVSGAAAILAGLPGNNNPATITWELQSTALDLGPPGFDFFYGYGLIQLDEAIQLALPLTPTPTVTATLTLTPTATLTLTPTSSATARATPTRTASASPYPTGIIARTPTAARESTSTPRPWIIFPPIFFFPTETPFPAATMTTTPTLTMTTAAGSLAGMTLTISPTPRQPIAENSRGIQAQQNTPTDDSLLLPCLSILLILAGLGLALVAIWLQRSSPGSGISSRISRGAGRRK